MCNCSEVFLLAYFLKKTLRGDRLYLSIYESFYSPDTKNTKHKSFKKIGFVDALVKSGIPDPVAAFQKEVDELNQKRKLEKQKTSSKQIGDLSPSRFLGYVPLAKVMNNLDVEDFFGFLSGSRSFQFDVYTLFCALVYARTIAPYSKWKTYNDIFPKMFPQYDFSYDQILEGLEFMGSEYEKIVEILTTATQDNYGIDASCCYFDCTNFYFEIDKESELQKKGPSKENRRDPVVGMGLLLDSGMIPIGMKIYPGNESEKPVLRQTIKDLKTRNHIAGRTIQIADKGLNCAANIIEAVNQGDGYLFSKSVKQLPAKEKDWVLLDNDYETVADEKGNSLYKIKSCVDSFTYEYKDEYGNKFVKTVTEKRIATYSFKLANKKNHEIDRMVIKARGLKASQAKKDEYGECSRYVRFVDDEGQKAKAVINEEAIAKDRMMAGYNMLVTSEVHMSSNEIYHAYHQLWAIEESFRIMKSELDARPVYVQKENSIKGHFLICYAAVLLTRILQYRILKNRYGAERIFQFMRDFTVTKVNERRYINQLTSSDLVNDLAATLNYPLTNFYLTESQIKMMHTR